ncbi:MAG: helix-turn-helix domain-containing protein [Vicinamibacterales bacterium]
MTREAFGPNLRRIRLQRGISMEQIAESTNIAQDLLEGLERNDFSEWPTGIFARAYVRQYAYAIGVDPDATVDEFCRFFLEGDRRAEGVIREQAAIVGHDLDWQDDVERGRRATDPGHEREGRSRVRPGQGSLLSRLRRLILASR